MPSPPLWEAGLVVVLALPQPFPVDIHPEPRPVVGLTAEALGLCCKVHGNVGGYATLMDVDSHPFLERFDVRDKGWVCSCFADHSVTPAGNLTWSMIALFWASLMPAE